MLGLAILSASAEPCLASSGFSISPSRTWMESRVAAGSLTYRFSGTIFTNSPFADETECRPALVRRKNLAM